MLRDFLYEIPDLLDDAKRESSAFQYGVFTVLSLLESKLKAFEIDQSRFVRRMPDIEAWYFRG